MNKNLEISDKKIFELINKEEIRQQEGLELIASENYCSQAVMQVQGSILTNKYAEGYPKKRYYDGCEYIDQIETLAIERVKKIFNANYANVQPHSGSQANMATYFALLNPGDKILGMDLSMGGHLTHGSHVNFSGKIYQTSFYGLDKETEQLDYDEILKTALKEKPKLLIAGASAYPRILDFQKFRDIADQVGAYLLVDMAHIAGLIAAKLHPDPIDIADVVTSTTHKTLRGPRGGIILSNNENLFKKLNSNIFPGIQGGPLEHVIGAKAVAFHEALDPSFIDYQKQVIKNAKALCQELSLRGIDLVSGGTDNHLLLLKTDSVNLSGKEASTLLEKVGITCNKNMIPGDTRSPFVTSGVRIGTPAITTRGMKEEEMKLVGRFIFETLSQPENDELHTKIRSQVRELCHNFPIYKDGNSK